VRTLPKNSKSTKQGGGLSVGLWWTPRSSLSWRWKVSDPGTDRQQGLTVEAARVCDLLVPLLGAYSLESLKRDSFHVCASRFPRRSLVFRFFNPYLHDVVYRVTTITKQPLHYRSHFLAGIF
jgi:hypothetical protein